MKCKTCQEPYHDTCPMEEGCSCCENTKESMEDYEGYDAENFDIINIEYMENGEETFDYPEEMLVSVETRKDDSIDHTKDSIRAKIKSYIRRNFGNDVEVVDFLAFPVGSDIQLGQLSFEFDAETFEAREKKIGSIRIVKNPNFPSGTSLQAYIKTNRAELRKVFGNPNMGESGDGKAKGKEWNLVVGGKRVTIYDYREKDKKGTKYFNIGGDGKYGALLVAQALSIHRNERVHAKEITPKWLEDERRHEMVQSLDDYPDLTYERAKQYEDNRRGRYRAETFDVEFNEWAEQEMMSHGKDISFKDWAEDEGMKHGNVPITEWAEHEEESHDARYGAESFEDFKRKMVGDKAVAGDVGYMEALEEFYEEYLEDFERITDEFCPEPETFEEFQERVLKNDYEMSLEAEDWGGNPKGRLALALQKARENAKKPKKPLKIEKLDGETGLDKVKHQHYKDMIAHLESQSDLSDMDKVKLQHYKDMVKLLGKNAETSGQWEIGEQLEEAQMNAETFEGIPQSVSDLEAVEDVRCDKYELEVNFENEDIVIVSGEELKAIMDDGWDLDSVRSFEGAGMSLLFTRNPNRAFRAEDKKRKKLSGQLSDPFDELSLDSGDWKGIVAGFGVGLLALFGYSKLRK